MAFSCNESEAKAFAEILNKLSESDLSLIERAMNKYLPDDPDKVDKEVAGKLASALIVITGEDVLKFLLLLPKVHPFCLKGLVNDAKIDFVKRIMVEKFLSLKEVIEELLDLGMRVAKVTYSPVTDDGVKVKVVIETQDNSKHEFIFDKEDMAELCRAYEKIFVEEELQEGG